MNGNDLKLRTKKFAVRVFLFIQKKGNINGTRKKQAVD